MATAPSPWARVLSLAAMDESTRTEHSALDPQPVRPNLPVPKSWGPFRILQKVGQGGFGEVYRAFDPTLEREVALKLLRPRGDASADGDSKAVLREARLMARVRHPNVVSVYGVDTHDGRVGFWSDFVRGKTLSELLTQQGPFGPKEAANIIIDLAKAVSAVHAAGLLHRDIKAGNAMREEGGRILLMDFGLTHEQDDGVRFAGTPVYMAPEILAGQPASVASDIYALGVLLFHLLTAKYPVSEPSTRPGAATPSRQRLLDLRSDLPEPLARVVEKATDSDPSKRYPTAGSLIAALSEGTVAETGLPSPAIQSAKPQGLRSAWIALPVVVVALGAGGYFLRPYLTHQAQVDSGSNYRLMEAHENLEHYYRPNALPTAVSQLEQYIKETPGAPAVAYADLARAYFIEFRNSRDPKLAEPIQRTAQKAIDLNKELVSPWVTLAMLHTLAGRTNLASDALKEALRLEPSNAEALAARGELYLTQGRKKEAEKEFRDAYDLGHDSFVIVNQLASYYSRTGDQEKELQYFHEAKGLAPDNPRAWHNLGRSYAILGRLDEARQAFEEAIRLEPGPSALASARYQGLGGVLLKQHKFAEAAASYEKAAHMNGNSYWTWSALAYSLRQIPGQEARSKEYYLKAISIAEELRKQPTRDPSLLVTLGACYAGIQNEAKAAPLLRQATLLAPEDPEVLFQAGIGYEIIHHREDALAALRQALDHGRRLVSIEQEPELARLRADPRFQKLRSASEAR